ncbi:MAG TPA: RDD family protein [Acidobacteriaceae bacterium]|nr:RDD family protein [Acidobacteriaceae bacterium]
MQGSVGRAVGEEMATQGLLRTGTDGTLFDTGAASLREAAAARVAAHRSKRAGAQAMEAAREEALRQEQARAERDVRRGASNVRDAVRARYEKSQSYRDFLAAEAERAVQQAQAEAEIAARNAKAIADAQMQLLEELKQEENSAVEAAPVSMMAFEEGRPAFEWDEPRIGLMEEPVAQSGDLFVEPPESLREVSTGGLTVRLYDDVGSMLSPQRTSSLGTPMLAGLSPAGARSRVFAEDRALESEELAELEQEIAFRRAPEFVDHIIETMPLPANLIEFPRELVATRKARPRLAEGPLREEAVPEPQLRIFEVEPEQISTEPVTAEEDVSEAPVWQGMLLDGPMMGPLPRPEAATAVGPVDIAPVSRRLMAAMVDGCCIGAALVGFATVASYISGPGLQAMSKPMLAGAVAFTFAIAALLYQLLFFSLNEATPGMRYARIGLCTFAEMNPTRKQKRRRVMAQVLAVCPLGLGLLWVLLDDDRLGWHDRISRIYQRSY